MAKKDDSSEFQTFSTGVFDRKGQNSLSSSAFYCILSLSLIWGLGLTAAIAYGATQLSYHPGIFDIIVIMAVSIAGCIIAVKSSNPIISFIGYNMIVVPFGAILGPYVNLYEPDIVYHAFLLTAGITLIMGTAGTIWPGLFKNLGGPLFIALLTLLGVRILQFFIPSLDLIWIDYLAAGIFSLYIGFDMYRASVIPRTVDNAIDLSVDLYLDIVNLFITILRILGKKS